MKKLFMTIAAFAAISSATSFAQEYANDSLTNVHLHEVQIVSTRATAKTPIAFTNVSKEELQKQNTGLDLPFLLLNTPSVITTSDAGAGIGYTSIRVRGTDATRINVTANGVPMNDAESHSVYWVNTPDLASSLQDIQVQRGAGTSTNGSGAFGASINMRTQNASSKAYGEVSGSYGSFNSHKETVRVGTGLLGNHWAFDARISNIGSDGYRDRASSDLKSYFAQGTYFGETTTLKFITFGGREKTYHAWDGISLKKLEEDRTYNPNGAIKDDNENKGNVIGYYDDQIDYYKQTHYQLVLTQRLTADWQFNAALHYTKGYGYYQEYKNGRTLKEYGLSPYYSPILNKDGIPDSYELIKKQNLIRKKIVDNHFGGGVFSLDYNMGRWAASIGGGANHYTNDHFGQVLWVKNYIGTLDPDHEYYRNTGKKTDANLYAKANYRITGGLHAYADLQYRFIHYTIDGTNDKWDWTASPEHSQILDVDNKFNFFNPKAGLFWQINANHSAYASFAMTNKEPTRNNYTDGLLYQAPKAERLYDYELGYTYRSEVFNAGINLYYMDYKDQLVLNGKLNEIGEPMAENVKHSYRMGVELMAGVQITRWLTWNVNATWSKNQIKGYTGYISDYDENWDELYSQTAIEVGDTPIAFSPTFMANSNIGVNIKGFQAYLQTQYVSRQYLDNFGKKADSLDPYCVSTLSANYTFDIPSLKSITVGATVYNLFNKKYVTNGYSQTAAIYQQGDKQLEAQQVSDPRFYPMAGTNVLATVTLRF